MIKSPCAALALAVCIAPAGAEETAAALTDLDFLIGEWSGEAVLYAPRDQSRAPLRETAKVACAYTLKETYIACDTAWRRETGKTRTFRL